MGLSMVLWAGQVSIARQAISRLTRTGSGCFSLCFNEHIPQDVDLVMTEQGELRRFSLRLTQISAINDHRWVATPRTAYA